MDYCFLGRAFKSELPKEVDGALSGVPLMNAFEAEITRGIVDYAEVVHHKLEAEKVGKLDPQAFVSVQNWDKSRDPKMPLHLAEARGQEVGASQTQCGYWNTVAARAALRLSLNAPGASAPRTPGVGVHNAR